MTLGKTSLHWERLGTLGKTRFNAQTLWISAGKTPQGCSRSRYFPLEIILFSQWGDWASVEFGPLKKDCWQQLLSVVPAL